jgi:AP endonuclease-2
MVCRNPFAYEPWRDKRTFEVRLIAPLRRLLLTPLKAMFEILETDIVVMQETKIQRRDLTDDMVLVPGWDVYFSLPKHKKGMSTSYIHGA